MIEQLYEAHLPVSNLKISISFYENLGLELSHTVGDRLAFFWIEKNKNWLGLWEAEEARSKYHPSTRHIAFSTSLQQLKNAVTWLKEKGINPRGEFGFEPIEPFVMVTNDNIAHAKIYFNDPDQNSLELICRLENNSRITKNMYLSEWESIIKDSQ